MSFIQLYIRPLFNQKFAV